jgi:ubiquinone/menaquinone biosynthesis C-methylase UbiE
MRETEKIAGVHRSKAQARHGYDRMSRFYDILAGGFESKCSNLALERLHIAQGEIVLEIGSGTGHCLEQIAERIGGTGKAYGIDISSGMLDVTRKRLERAGLMERVELVCGDAAQLPFDTGQFDCVFSSFSIELFDTPEIPIVLGEISRVLKPHGRIGIVSMSKEEADSILSRLYEWFHETFPIYADCRPIYVGQSIKEAGFEIMHKEKVSLSGLPCEIVIGVE